MGAFPFWNRASVLTWQVCQSEFREFSGTRRTCRIDVELQGHGW
jgi:hypothetical protein